MSFSSTVINAENNISFFSWIAISWKVKFSIVANSFKWMVWCSAVFFASGPLKSQDNFIFLGGHSLVAIRITARLNEELDTTFPLNKIFEFPTIEAYASYIEKTLVALLND